MGRTFFKQNDILHNKGLSLFAERSFLLKVCVCRALGILVMSQKRFTHALLTNRSIQLFQAVRTRLISSTIN